MFPLTGKKILLGVTGGIAAYKSAALLRLLRAKGAEVCVVMTQAANEFIRPLTFQALSGKPVHTDLFDQTTESAMGHIDLARWADMVLIAPASANFIARYTNGFASDLLSTICLATDAPILLAPAMNQQMWLNPATQENIKKVKARGAIIIGPAEGEQACGEEGPGRMLEEEEIAQRITTSFKTTALSGLRVLVTAGPTQEAIDPVRYITNKSSGKMGYAIAHAALDAGADVMLISGPVNIIEPEGVALTKVRTTKAMHDAVMQRVTKTDIFISAAAVADYQVVNSADQKIKKSADTFQLQLKRNLDILATVSEQQHPPFSVGFAAETENLVSNAQAKLRSKKLDMIVANLVGDGRGFEVDENELTAYWHSGHQHFERASKLCLAKNLIKLIAKQYNEKNKNQTH